MGKRLVIVDGAAPSPKGQQGRLLSALLRGEQIDGTTALATYNVSAPMARAAELRAMGWPVHTKKLPHPRYPRRTYPVYFFDAHFLRWLAAQEGPIDPGAYPHNAGRGRFRV